MVKSSRTKVKKFTHEEIMMGLQVVEARQRLDAIAQIIENVDNRCMAADGPVTATLREMTQEEIKEIYELAKQHRKAGHPIEVYVSQHMFATPAEPVREKKGRDWYVHLKRGVQHFRLDYTGTRVECEWMAHQLRHALAGGEIKSTDGALRDAGMLIRRLLHRVIKDNPALPRPALCAQADGWLKRQGLIGSILRKEK